jgi:hypothetical protein
MNESILKATYHGEVPLAGDISLNVGSEYDIRVRQGLFGRIFVTPCHGYAFKPYVDMTMKYPSLHHFFHDWQPKQLLHETKHIYFGGQAQ